MFPVLRDNNNSAHSPVAMGPINRLDWLLNPFFGDDGGFRGRAWSGAPVAIWEDDDHIHLEAELPGVSDDDVEVTVHNGTLFIRGQRKPEQGRRYLYNDREYGRFERIVNLPEAVMTEDVQATLTHGVLRVDLPKCPRAKPKKITLQAS